MPTRRSTEHEIRRMLRRAAPRGTRAAEMKSRRLAENQAIEQGLHQFSADPVIVAIQEKIQNPDVFTFAFGAPELNHIALGQLDEKEYRYLAQQHGVRLKKGQSTPYLDGLKAQTPHQPAATNVPPPKETASRRPARFARKPKLEQKPIFTVFKETRTQIKQRKT